MRKQLRQEVIGIHIPRFICEILTNNYSEGFLRMSIIKDGEKYLLSYDCGYYERLDRRRLLTPSKLYIIRAIFEINELNEKHLIAANRYLIEPELVYIRNGVSDNPRVRLMFYPDSSELDFNVKIIRFMRSILDLTIADENDIYTNVRRYLDAEDYNGARRYLDLKSERIGIVQERAI